MSDMKFTENDLHRIVRNSIMHVLYEANEGPGITLTTKKIQSLDNRTRFNKDDALNKAMLYPTIGDLYKDRKLTAALRYHGLLEYVKSKFREAGKYKPERGKRGKAVYKWTPESALEYASNFINGFELRENPDDPKKGVSCYHYLRNRDLNGNVVPTEDKTTPRLLSKAFKDARMADAENASRLLVNREMQKEKDAEQRKKDTAERLARQKQETALRKENMKAERKKQAEANLVKSKQEREKKLRNDIVSYVKHNGIKTRMELYYNNYNYYRYAAKFGMMEQLFGNKAQKRADRLAKTEIYSKIRKKAQTPADAIRLFKKKYPWIEKELTSYGSNFLNRYYPEWRYVKGEWVRK